MRPISLERFAILITRLAIRTRLAVMLRFPGLMRLLFTLLIRLGLLLARLELTFALPDAAAIAGIIVAIIKGAVACLALTVEGILLPELFLHRSDHPQIMFRVLKIVLRCNRIAGRL